MRTVTRTRSLYTDVLGRAYTSDDLDDWGPGTVPFAVLTAALDQLEGQRRRLNERMATLASGPRPTLTPAPARAALRPGLVELAPITAPVGGVVFGVLLSCGCTTAIDGRCAVHG
jgi:hypothetical protein